MLRLVILIEDVKPSFEKTTITSCCRLNYDEVQDMLDGKEIDQPPVYGGHEWREIQEDIFLLYEVCGKIRRSRFEGGALSVSKPKMIFHVAAYDDDDGATPRTFHLDSHGAAHWIIEELMLLANRCVAKHLVHSRLADEGSVLRNHARPDSTKMMKLSTMMRQNLRLDWTGSTLAGDLHRASQEMYQAYGRSMGQCVDMMIMRSGMMQASYFIYNTERTEEQEGDPHHYALNFDYYTHFTSPIRRYPDIMVHRALFAEISGRDDGFMSADEGKLQVEVCNTKQTDSRKCSEQLDRSVFCIYLRSLKTWYYTVGTVLKIAASTRTGHAYVTVYCTQLGKEKKVTLTDITEISDMKLMTNGINDTLLFPKTWETRGKGRLDLAWPAADDVSGTGPVVATQKMQVFSCVPIVIIPTDTAPIDYMMFFVSPQHARFAGIGEAIPEPAREGMRWHDDSDDEVEGPLDVGWADQ